MPGRRRSRVDWVDVKSMLDLFPNRTGVDGRSVLIDWTNPVSVVLTHLTLCHLESPNISLNTDPG